MKKTCSAKDRITEVEQEIRFLHERKREIIREIPKKEKELRELKEGFKLPGFWKNIPMKKREKLCWLHDAGNFDKDSPIHNWMYDELRKVNAWRGYLTDIYLFLGTSIEIMYNRAVLDLDSLEGYPMFPPEFIVNPKIRYREYYDGPKEEV